MSPNPQRRNRPRPARGVVLIEVMVSILIFVFGMLGVVALQTNMVRAQTSAKARADAAYLANQIVGSMWGDIAHLSQYDTASTCDGYARCATWLAAVASALPAGTAEVTPDAATGLVSVTIRWGLPGEEAHSFSTKTHVHTAL